MATDQTAIGDLWQINAPRDWIEWIVPRTLKWSRTVLRRTFGVEAEEYAGIGLMDAVRLFLGPFEKTDRCEAHFKKMAAAVLRFQAMNGFCRDHGKPLSRKRHQHQMQISFDTDPSLHDRVKSDRRPEADMLEDEDMQIALQRIDQFDGVRRLVIILRFLADADDKDIAYLLGVQPQKVFLGWSGCSSLNIL